MAATALILFNQGGPGTAGQAFIGTVAGGLVSISNDDNTDVASWRITLLDVPPDSALVPGVLASANSATPAASFTPDVPGSFRVLLEVFESIGLVGVKDRDIRNFGIRNARGLIIPPYQKLPDPLPVLGSSLPGEKPDEQNYGGQTRGWTGDRTTDGQLEQFFATFDDTPLKGVTSTPFTAAVTGEEPVYFFNVTGAGTFNLPSGARTGQRFRVIASTTVTLLTINPHGGGNINGLSSVQIFGGASATLIYRGGTNWTILGLKRWSYERTVFAGLESTSTTGFTSIGAIVIAPEEYPNLSAVTWNAILETTDGGDAAEIQLYNVTTASVVASSTLSTTSLVPVLLTATISLAAGVNVYEAQIRLTTTGSPNRATCKQAQLILTGLQ